MRVSKGRLLVGCLLLLTFVLLGCGAPGPSATTVPTPSGPQAATPTPLPTAVVEEVEANVQTVRLQTADGVTIVGTYYVPPAQNAPGVILLHMVARNRADWEPLARKLQAAGFAVLAIDLRGHGESGGSRAWGRMPQDVVAAQVFLSRQPEVDKGRIAIVGASIGANLALDFAASHGVVRSVVLLSPGLDYRGIKTERAMQEYDRPVLIVASAEDQYAAESSRKLDSLAQGKHQLQIYQGAGHGTQMLEHEPSLSDLILTWLQDTL